MPRTSWTAALAVLCLLGATRPASASSFSVNPMRIVLSPRTTIFLAPRTTSALLTLRNDSDDTRRFRLTAFKWDQTPQGDMTLEPTEDVVFFPMRLSLAPNEERNVRVGAVAPFAAVEKTYWIFVEELPSRAGGPTLTKLGVPIFLQPARGKARGGLDDLMVKDGVFTFTVHNSGTVHAAPQTVRVQGRNAVGQVVLDTQVEGSYILAGGLREYAMSLPSSVCRTIAGLSVDILIGTARVTAHLQTPAACSP